MFRPRLAPLALAIPILAAAPLALARPAPGDDPYFSCGQWPLFLSFGPQAFSTVGATTSAQTEGLCQSIANGPQIFNDIWFTFTAPCAGWYTVDTCAGATFDTKLAVYAGIPFHTTTGCGGTCLVCIPDNNLAIACNDDNCGGLTSAATFLGNAGQEYAVRLGAYANGQTGTGTITLSGPGCGPPHVEITSPAAFGVVCNPTTITGIAEAADGLAGYTLEYSTSPQGPWTLIASLITPVPSPGGTLAIWNTTFVTEGYKFVRLTALDNNGTYADFTTVMYVDTAFNGIDIRKPLNNALLGGVVCPDGSINDYSFVNYRVEYAPPPFSAYSPVDPAIPISTSAVVNDPLQQQWNTRSGPSAVADGNYRMRFTGLDACNHIATVSRDVTIDNTAPVAVIAAPLSCTNVNGIVTIRGTVTDAHLASWYVQVMGGSSHTWTTIGSGSGPMLNATLATWNTSGLTPCPYVIRLIASDAAAIDCERGSNSTEYGIVVNVGCPADFNRDGVANSQDFFDFLTAFFAGC